MLKPKKVTIEADNILDFDTNCTIAMSKAYEEGFVLYNESFFVRHVNLLNNASKTIYTSSMTFLQRGSE